MRTIRSREGSEHGATSIAGDYSEISGEEFDYFADDVPDLDQLGEIYLRAAERHAEIYPALHIHFVGRSASEPYEFCTLFHRFCDKSITHIQLSRPVKGLTWDPKEGARVTIAEGTPDGRGLVSISSSELVRDLAELLDRYVVDLLEWVAQAAPTGAQLARALAMTSTFAGARLSHRL